jgi:uncharacterized protein (TIGR04255 family)
MVAMPPAPEPFPEFDAPPINEVVLGIQFEDLQGYSLVRSGEVFSLFERDYPTVQEAPPLQPNFETFGALQPGPQMGFSFTDRPDHPRFWFVTPGGHELVQFQRDRLFHNWRQVDGKGPAEYPRFGSVFAKFAAEAARLQDYVRGRYQQELKINQVEVTYFNRIYSSDPKRLPPVSEFFRFLHLSDSAEGFDGVLRQVIEDDTGSPIGRLYTEVRSAIDMARGGLPNIAFNLTFRGPPAASDLRSALESVRVGHEIAVRSFSHVTTDSAHQIWRRRS